MKKDELWETIKRHADLRGITDDKKLYLLEKEFEYEYNNIVDFSPDGFIVKGFFDGESVVLYLTDNRVNIEKKNTDDMIAWTCFFSSPDETYSGYGYGESPDDCISDLLSSMVAKINKHKSAIANIEALISLYTPFRQN